MPRYFILFFRKIKEYVPQGGEKVRLPRVGEMVDTSILYTAVGALMLVISTSIFLYGAVKDYRVAAANQNKQIVQAEASSQQNIQSPNTSVQTRGEQTTSTSVNPVSSSPDAVRTSKRELPKETVVNMEPPVVKSRKETPISPVKGKIIVSYGWREHPLYKDWRFHPGVNIQTTEGDRIRAALSGKVIGIHKDTTGIMIKTAHEDGVTLVYGNIKDTDVRAGQYINQGQPLGIVGENSIEPGIYLHFEVWKDDRSVDPQRWMKW